MTADKLRGWLIDVVAGAVVGGLIGAIVAVNIVIYSGAERGYESSLTEVFEHSPLAGIITVVIVVAGPVSGIVVARRRRRRRRPENRL